MDSSLAIILTVFGGAFFFVYLSGKISTEGKAFGLALKIMLVLGALSILMLNSSLPLHFVAWDNATSCARVYGDASNFTESCVPPAAVVASLESSLASNMQLTMWIYRFFIGLLGVWVAYHYMSKLKDYFNRKKAAEGGLGDDFDPFEGEA